MPCYIPLAPPAPQVLAGGRCAAGEDAQERGAARVRRALQGAQGFSMQRVSWGYHCPREAVGPAEGLEAWLIGCFQAALWAGTESEPALCMHSLNMLSLRACLKGEHESCAHLAVTFSFLITSAVRLRCKL